MVVLRIVFFGLPISASARTMRTSRRQWTTRRMNESAFTVPSSVGHAGRVSGLSRAMSDERSVPCSCAPKLQPEARGCVSSAKWTANVTGGAAGHGSAAQSSQQQGCSSLHRAVRKQSDAALLVVSVERGLPQSPRSWQGRQTSVGHSYSVMVAFSMSD